MRPMNKTVNASRSAFSGEGEEYQLPFSKQTEKPLSHRRIQNMTIIKTLADMGNKNIKKKVGQEQSF